MLNLIKYLLIAGSVFYTQHSSSQQQRGELEKQKDKIQKEIKATNHILEKIKQQKDKSLQHVKILSNQVKNQKDLLENIDSKITQTKKRKKETKSLFFQTEEDIKRINKMIQEILIEIKEKEKLQRKLEKEYAHMIYKAYVWKNTYNDFYFLMSAEDFHHLYKRKEYLKKNSEDRKKKIKRIKENKKKLREGEIKLHEARDSLEKKQLNLKGLSVEIGEQDSILINDRTQREKQLKKSKIILDEKNKLKKDLQKQEKKYLQQISKKKQKEREIQNKISKIIEEEIRIAQSKSNKTNSIKMPETPESLEISFNFESSKGNLPWPVDKGVIIERFGKQKHVVFSNIEINNNGIDIETNENQKVRSIFKGKVSRIFFVSGIGKSILINHGKYFTVYSGLKEVFVANGEEVKSKQEIGVVQKTTLHFEIWKGREKQNPDRWIYNAD